MSTKQIVYCGWICILLFWQSWGENGQTRSTNRPLPQTGLSKKEKSQIMKTQKRAKKFKMSTRFETDVRMFVFDKTGKRLIAPGAAVYSKGYSPDNGKSTLIFNDRYNGKPVIVLFELTRLKDSTFELGVWQFRKLGRRLKKSDPKNVAGKAKVIMTDYEPFTWRSVLHESARVLVRFTLDVKTERAPQDMKDLEHFPLCFDNGVITDSKGRLWTSRFSLQGNYLGVQTKKGTLYLSLYPFKGGKPMGVAQGKSIELEMADSVKIYIESKSMILPGKMRALVYALLDPEKSGAKKVFAAGTPSRLFFDRKAMRKKMFGF